MEITREIYNSIVEEKKALVKEELGRLGVDMTNEYGSYTARYGILENIKELGKLGVDITTEYGSYTAKNGTPSIIKKHIGQEEITLEEVCKELGRNVKIVK